MSNWSLTARYVFPVDGPPLPHGIVVVAHDKIAAVEPHGTRTADVDLGNVAVLPGLVNAHTHLDLTGLRDKCPPTPDFTQWLSGVIAHRRGQTPEQIATDIQAGIKESIATGTTLVGDIAVEGASWILLTNAKCRSVVFHELLGLVWDRTLEIGRKVGEEFVARKPTKTCRAGLSPHAPYSTHRVLYDFAFGLAQQSHAPVATHLAETLAELELLTHRTGPFVKFLEQLGVWNAEGLFTDPADVIRECRRWIGFPPVLLIHANYLLPDTPIETGTTIIYCPRTHAAFGHAPHPFREFLRRGVRVALGTDSLASNPDLSILAEMRFIHERYPDFPGDTLLRMGTLSGAEALGWADETGSLTPGKSADLVVVPLPDEEGEPHQLLFTSQEPVARTLFRGQWR